MRFDGPVLCHGQAGVVDLEAAVAAMSRLAEQAGADVRRGVAVEGLEPVGEHVRLPTSAGPVRARKAVVTAGPWTAGLLAGVVPLPPLGDPAAGLLLDRRGAQSRAVVGGRSDAVPG